MLSAAKIWSFIVVLALCVASCASDGGDAEASYAAVTEEQAEIENAREFTVDVEVTAQVEFGARGSAVVIGSVRAPDERGVSEATVTYTLSNGMTAAGMSPECVQEDRSIVCSLVRDLLSESNSTVGTESFVTELELLVDAGAVDPTVTVAGSSAENPVSNDPVPENNVVVLDLSDALAS